MGGGVRKGHCKVAGDRRISECQANGEETGEASGSLIMSSRRPVGSEGREVVEGDWEGSGSESFGSEKEAMLKICFFLNKTGKDEYQSGASRL